MLTHGATLHSTTRAFGVMLLLFGVLFQECLTQAHAAPIPITLLLDPTNGVLAVDPLSGEFSNCDRQTITSILVGTVANTTDPLIGAVVKTHGYVSSSLGSPIDTSVILTDVATSIFGKPGTDHVFRQFAGRSA